MIYIFLLMSISTILSYLILKFIYRIIFKSKKKISKFLVFLGSIGLIIFYHTPYSYYLEPSFYKFREICKLDPEIYQANGGKIDEEYYNKILGYFGLSLDTLDWESIEKNIFLNDSKEYIYKQKQQNNRINSSLFIVFKNHIILEDNIDYIWAYMEWDNKRNYLATAGIGSYELVIRQNYENCIISTRINNEQ